MFAGWCLAGDQQALYLILQLMMMSSTCRTMRPGLLVPSSYLLVSPQANSRYDAATVGSSDDGGIQEAWDA